MLTSKFFIQFIDRHAHLLLSMIFLCLCGCAAGLSSEQQAIVNDLYLATLQLPNHAKRVFISPKGILEVETTSSEDAYEEGNGGRTLFDVHSGVQIWSGPLRGSNMITDDPSPIIIETTDSSTHTISRYDLHGNVVWQTAVEGLFVFGLAHEEQGMILTLSLTPAKEGSLQAILHGITLIDGNIRWRSELCDVSLADYPIGSLWRYQARPIFAYKDNAFLLLENRAFSISVADGKVIANKPIPYDSKTDGHGNMIWLPEKDDILVVSGSQVLRLSDRADRQWYVTLGENKIATDALLMGQDLVIAFTGKATRGVAILDTKTATWRWQSSLQVHDGAQPKGIAVVGENVFIASLGSLHGFDRKTGRVLFSHKISADLLTLFNHDNGIILSGLTSIELHNPIDGSLIWKKGNMAPPIAWFYKQRQSSMAILRANMQAAATASANQSRWCYDNANRKIGGAYAQDTWARQQYTKLGSAAGSSEAAANFDVSLVDLTSAFAPTIQRKVSILVDMQSSEPVQDHAYFLIPAETKVLVGQTNTSKLAVINLTDGTTSDIPVRKAPTTCIPTVMVNENLGLIIEAYHKFPFCHASQTVDILRLPDTFTKRGQP
jgi:hypothetical protein